MRAARGLLALMLVGALAGCGEKTSEPAAAADDGAATATAASATAGTATAGSATAGSGSTTDADGAALPPVVAVDEAAVKQLVDAWLVAQNTGDFAAYQGVYAERFEGIKRAGVRTWRFDREGWLADRARMFKHPMTVAATDMVIRGGAAVATVELTQTFSQGKFADQGPKQLVLVNGEDGFKIAREEMLRSEVGGGAASAAKPTAFTVLAIDKRPHVVIQADADLAWGRGRPTGPYQDAHMLATVDASNAPAAAIWANRALKVHDADGNQCDATVGALKLVAGGTPHFGEVQRWDNALDMGDGHVWSPAERARAVFGSSSAYLVGALEITGACNPVLALDATAVATVFAKAPSDAALAAAALAAFIALPEYAALQRDFVESGEGTGPWAPTPSVTTLAAGGRRFIGVSASVGSGCSGFLGKLAVLFEEQGGKLTLVSDPAGGFLRIDLLVDSDGDGKVEAIGAIDDSRMVTGHFVPAAKGFTAVTEVTFPYSDCGC